MSRKQSLRVSYDRACAILDCMPIMTERPAQAVPARIAKSIALQLDHRLAKMAARPYDGHKRLHLHEHEALVLREVISYGMDWAPEDPLLRSDLRQATSEIDGLLVGATPTSH